MADAKAAPPAAAAAATAAAMAAEMVEMKDTIEEMIGRRHSMI